MLMTELMMVMMTETDGGRALVMIMMVMDTGCKH